MVTGRDAAPFPISKLERESADAPEQDAFDTVPPIFYYANKKALNKQAFLWYAYKAKPDCGGYNMKKAIVTVVGHDRVGIIARVATLLAEYGVNVLDISQTVMNEYFTMVMLVDVQGCTAEFTVLRDALNRLGEEMALSIRIQHEDIFNAMHSVN